ncbi:uncharacterized protein [Procambarus clarkii]|uniref:uncharacterized protein n=1 Tax=Procambarus clarkii TaxID=6728 RepID=UPI003742837E
MQHPVINDRELYNFRYYLAVTKAARDEIAAVFKCLYKGNFPIPPPALYGKSFSHDEKEILSKNINPDNFDFTLLYKLLQRVCNLAPDNDPKWWTSPGDLEPSLEHLLYKLKTIRNKIIHESKTITTQQDLEDKLTKLSDIVWEMLLKAGSRCRRLNVDETLNVGDRYQIFTNYISGLSAKIREPLDPSDTALISRFRQEYNIIMNRITQHVKFRSKQELAVYRYRYPLYLSHLSFTSIGLRLFKDPAIGSAPSQTAKGHDINYEEFLSMIEDGRVPQCVLLTGEGGMGKTTLLKLILEKWVEDPAAIRHLGTVDLVFYVQCGDTHLNTFDDLLRQLLPQTLRDSQVDFQLFKEIILSLNILVLIDGYDAVNDHSGRLVKELLHLPGKDVRLVITTRPGWDQHLSQLVPHTRPRCNILVLGITPERRVEFAERTIKVLVKEERKRSVITERFTQRLEQMSQFLGEYLNTPLTLTLLALLCVEAPDKFNNLTTITQVYEKIHDLKKNKLVSTLEGYRINDPRGKCENLMFFIEEVSLRGIKRQEYDFFPETKEEIRKKCDTLGLPPWLVLDYLLTSPVYHQGYDAVWIFEYVCTRYQEHCAGRSLVTQLITEENLRDQRNTNLVHRVLLEGQNNASFIKYRYQNILLSSTYVMNVCEFEQNFSSWIIQLVWCNDNEVDNLLKHIVESHNNEHVINAVHERLQDWNCWKIKCVDSCAVLPLVLNRVIPDSEIVLEIESRLQQNQLMPALRVLMTLPITVNVLLYGHYFYRNDDDDLSNIYLETLTAPGSSCTLEQFVGRLSKAAIPHLPPTLRSLALRLTLQELPVLTHRLQDLRRVHKLSIIVEATGNEDLATLPSLQYRGCGLELTIVCSFTDDSPDLDWCCRLARQLCPRTSTRIFSYPFLNFCGTDLTSVGVEKLLRGLDREGVTTNNLLVEVTDYLSLEEDHRLRDLALKFGILGFQVTWTGRRRTD